MGMQRYELYIWERANPNPRITYAVSFRVVAPEPPAGLSIVTFNADVFLTKIQNPKALILVTITDARKYEQIN